MTDGDQATLTGDGTAERVTCEYYDGCTEPALFVDDILHYGEGERPVKMCATCADEHGEGEDTDIRRLKPAARYVGPAPDEATVWVVASRKSDSPHPFVEAVYDNEDAAAEHKRELKNNSFSHDVVAWDVFEQRVNSDYLPRGAER